MAGSLRSHIQQAHAQNSGSSSSSSSHPMMSHQGSSQSGGRRKRRSKGKMHKRRRSRRAGSNCASKMGGSSKSRAAKGGMNPGLGAVIKEALVPFGLFAMQKRTQRRRSNGYKSKMSRRR